MMKFVIPALAAGLLLGSATVTPSSAAPITAAPIAAPESTVDTVAYRRHHRMHRRHMMRHRMMNRRMMRRRAMNRSMYAPRNAGNAKNPALPVYQQNQGNTTGGYRR